jgi:hypothetical protein
MNEQENSKLTAFHKVNDWYATHNFGTRFAMLTFVALYVTAVLVTLDFDYVANADANLIKQVVDVHTNVALVELTGYLAFFSFLIVTLGDNALSKIVDLIAKIKSK